MPDWDWYLEYASVKFLNWEDLELWEKERAGHSVGHAWMRVAPACWLLCCLSPGQQVSAVLQQQRDCQTTHQPQTLRWMQTSLQLVHWNDPPISRYTQWFFTHYNSVMAGSDCLSPNTTHTSLSRLFTFFKIFMWFLEKHKPETFR